MFFRWTLSALVGCGGSRGGTFRLGSESHGGPKKLIEWGWDEPDPKFMRQNIAKMEQLPFDGVIFHVAGNRGGNLSWEPWGSRKFELAEFSPRHRRPEGDALSSVDRPLLAGQRHARQRGLV